MLERADARQKDDNLADRMLMVTKYCVDKDEVIGHPEGVANTGPVDFRGR